jgi:hypothetical protein
MRRSILLTNEGASHPFRQAMPPLDRAPLRRSAFVKRNTDLAFFGTCFTAFFVLIFGMIL